MDRLTYKTEQNERAYCPPSVKCNGKCSECVHIDKMMNKLAEYEDAEEQGLLLKLPCKVGDVIYQVNSDVDEYAISEISIREDKVLITAENLEEGLGFCFDANRIGKKYFLTEEEAEQALAKMKEV